MDHRLGVEQGFHLLIGQLLNLLKQAAQARRTRRLNLLP
jgi:hypothetical protein